MRPVDTWNARRIVSTGQRIALALAIVSIAVAAAHATTVTPPLPSHRRKYFAKSRRSRVGMADKFPRTRTSIGGESRSARRTSRGHSARLCNLLGIAMIVLWICFAAGAVSFAAAVEGRAELESTDDLSSKDDYDGKGVGASHPAPNVIENIELESLRNANRDSPVFKFADDTGIELSLSIAARFINLAKTDPADTAERLNALRKLTSDLQMAAVEPTTRRLTVETFTRLAACGGIAAASIHRHATNFGTNAKDYWEHYDTYFTALRVESAAAAFMETGKLTEEEAYIYSLLDTLATTGFSGVKPDIDRITEIIANRGLEVEQRAREALESLDGCL